MYTRIATKDTDIHTDNNTRTSCYVSIYNIFQMFESDVTVPRSVGDCRMSIYWQYWLQQHNPLNNQPSIVHAL